MRIILAILFCSIYLTCPAQGVNKSFNTGIGNEEKDTLIGKYLSDTLNATSKVRQLIEEARGIKNNPLAQINDFKRYQIALTLAPYVKDSPSVLFRLNTQFGDRLFAAGASDLAMQYLKTALVYCRQEFPKPSTASYNLVGKIGSYYLKDKAYDSSEHYFQLALNEAVATNESLSIAAAYNNIGILRFEQGDNLNAGKYFDKAIASLPTNTNDNDAFLRSSIRDNMAQLAMRNGGFANALQLYQENLKYYETRHNGYHDLFKSHEGLAMVYLREGKLAPAADELQVLYGYMHVQGNNLKIDYYIRYHELMQSYYTQQQNWKSAANEQKELRLLDDSLLTERGKQLDGLLQALTYSQVYKFKKDLQLNQIELAQQEKNLKATRLFTFIVSTLGLAILILLVAYFRNKNKVEKELHTKDIELGKAKLSNQRLLQEKLERELDYKQKDISDLALYMSQLKDLNDTIMNKLDELKTKRPEEQKTAIHTMVNELGAMMHSHEKLSMIQENVDVLNREFLDKLMTTFPGLTKSEVELCGFLRLNMSNKEIGILKNISPQSVKVARHRLRKKLQVPSEEDIGQFLSDF